MAHLLKPHDNEAYLMPDEIVARLKGEFTHCTASRDEGDDIVGDTIAKLIELKAPQEIIDQQIAAQAYSIAVVVAVDASSDDSLQFTVKPNEGILIGYFSGQHEDATRTLLDRCASVLNYRIGFP